MTRPGSLSQAPGKHHFLIAPICTRDMEDMSNGDMEDVTFRDMEDMQSRVYGICTGCIVQRVQGLVQACSGESSGLFEHDV